MTHGLRILFFLSSGPWEGGWRLHIGARSLCLIKCPPAPTLYAYIYPLLNPAEILDTWSYQ